MRLSGRSRPKKILDAKAAKAVAYDLLSRKTWSRRDLTARLVRRGAPAEVARQVIGELEGQGYVDDPAFARQWAEARARRQRMGSRRIGEELRAKGIPQPLAAAAVRHAFSEVPEEAQALDAARRRLPVLSRGNPARLPSRLLEYLLRRGYPPETARRVVRQLCRVEDPEG
jgi:regulatory protein